MILPSLLGLPALAARALLEGQGVRYAVLRENGRLLPTPPGWRVGLVVDGGIVSSVASSRGLQVADAPLGPGDIGISGEEFTRQWNAEFSRQNAAGMNDARVRAGVAVLYDAVQGHKLSAAQIQAATIGAVALVNPALGAGLAASLTMLQLFGAGAMAIAKALGVDAHGVSWNPCDHPPSGPSDPNWYPDAANREREKAYWALDKPDLLPGSFPAWAVPILQANRYAWENCRPSIDEYTLLHQLQVTWNNAHEGPTQILYPGGGYKQPYTWGNHSGITEADLLRIRGTVVDGKWQAPDPPPPDWARELELNAGAPSQAFFDKYLAKASPTGEKQHVPLPRLPGKKSSSSSAAPIVIGAALLGGFLLLRR